MGYWTEDQIRQLARLKKCALYSDGRHGCWYLQTPNGPCGQFVGFREVIDWLDSYEPKSHPQ